MRRTLAAPETVAWRCGGVPLTAIAACTRSRTGDIDVAVAPSRVDLRSGSYSQLLAQTRALARAGRFVNRGPVQFGRIVSSTAPLSWALDVRAARGDYVSRVDRLHALLEATRLATRPGCDSVALDTALAQLEALSTILRQLSLQQRSSI